jgi:prepilin-type N-terminal cleavage/methylation domain-containing protein
MTLRTGSKFGLTLIEILVSVAILAAGAVLIMQALLRGAYALTFAEQRFHAYTFSVGKLADVETALHTGQSLTPHGRFRMGKDQFTWQLDASPLPEDPQLELVTLTVGWGAGRQERSTRIGLLRRVPEEDS